MIRKLLDRLGFASREQRSLTYGVLGLAGLLLIVLPLGLQTLAFAKRSSNNELRDALQKVQLARNDIRARKERKDSVVQRYAKKAPPLAGYLEQTAKAQKLEVIDSNDRQAITYGKRYTERITVVHLRKSGMLPIARLFEAIEQSGSPTSISRLNIRKRPAEPNAYDVELGVSAFDREELKAGKDAKDEKSKDEKK
jgi:general secretion pathway protein M